MDINSIGSVSQPRPGVSASPEAPPPAVKTVATPVEIADAVKPSAQVPSMGQLAQAVKSLNKAMESRAQGLEFSIDSDSHRTIIKVIDQKTKDVIRQIPSEEALQIASALEQAQGGLLISQKA
jgi:flagellar protein FlaG